MKDFRATREHAVIYFSLECSYTAECAVIRSLGADGWHVLPVSPHQY